MSISRTIRSGLSDSRKQIMKCWAKRFSVIVFIWGWCNAPASSFAQGDPPSSDSSGGNSECHYADGYCRCGKDKIKLDAENPPQGVSLDHASCIWIKKPKHLSGIFVYKGNWSAEGVIKRQEDEMFGDTITFVPKTWRYDIKFLGNPTIDDRSRMTMPELIAKLKLPQLSVHDNCWMANAVLTIKAYTVVDDETDYSGVYVEKFEVNQLGNYRSCSQKAR